MKAIIRSIVISLTISSSFAFNFTSEDFDEASVHVNYDSIATTDSDTNNIKEEINEGFTSNTANQVVAPPPIPKSSTYRFYSASSDTEKEVQNSVKSGVDVENLAKQIYWVHSFKVMELNNPKWSFANNATIHPKSVASVIKLPVVNVALREMKAGKINPRKQLKVTANNIQSYDGEPVGQSYTVTKAIHATLYRSSNTCPNLLAQELGGLDATKTKLKQLGYGSTGYNYLSAKKRTETPSFKVGSTADDLADSVYDFYHKYRHVQNINRRDSAWHAFTKTKYKIKVPGATNTGGKIGTNSNSSTYAGIYNINGIDYIIVTLIDRQSFNKKYKGRINADKGDKALEEANAIIVKTIQENREINLSKGN